MHLAGSDLVVSPTDLSGFLACRHLTTLELAEARGGPSHPHYPDPGRDVLRELGKRHEAAILAGYRARGLRIAEPTQPTREEGVNGGWERLAAETLDAMRAGVDVVYQGGFFDGRWLGRPDFLVKSPYVSELGDWLYEVVDAKLSRSAKVGAVLQICSYSEMLSEVQGASPPLMHLALGGPHEDGSDNFQTFLYGHFAAYYRSVKRRFQGVVEADIAPATYPELCDHCALCDWSTVCDARWREDDHLSLVAGITKRQRGALESRGVARLEDLAGLAVPLDPPLEGVSAPAFGKIREQARIQLEGRHEERPKHEILEGADAGTGLLALPEPTAGDLFFDIERERYGLYEDGLAYLFGYVDASGAFTGLWALDAEAERRQFEAFVDTVMARLDEWPGMHVYHYAEFEKTALKRLAHRYATRENEIDRMLRGGVLVDLYRVVRQGIRASVESYSITKLEPLYSFRRDVELRAASAALAHFEAWLQLGGNGDGVDELIQEVEGYNRDDCVSTLRLRDWLEGLRSHLERGLQDEGRLEGPLARPEPPDPEASADVREEEEEVRALMDALMDGISEHPEERSPEDQAKWMLAHLLSWHRREEKSVFWEYYHLLEMDEDERLHDTKALARLEYDGPVDTVAKSIIHRYRFPPQECAVETGEKKNRDPVTRKNVIVWAIDEDGCTLDIKRGRNSNEPHPSSLIPWQYIRTDEQKAALRRLARDVVEHGLDGAPNRAAVDLLLRRPPRAGQPEGAFLWQYGASERTLGAARRIVTQLDRTVLPIQGPPGSGKTYIGARMITELIRAGRRVGVMATSHKVIGNLLREVCKAAREQELTFQAIQKASEQQAHADPFIDRTDDNRRVAEALTAGEVDLVAGTHWLWSREEMAGTVDVLVVDEAGQISLANVLAASAAADSIVLLGDPQQLDQPQKGVHPPGTEVSALEHLVRGATVSPERGLFLEETWRLPKDICRFTSPMYYDGKLRSRYDLVRQGVDGPEPFRGTGLRFVPVEHEGNTSESSEEVEVVAELIDRLQASEPIWTHPTEGRKPLTLRDILVVAPYNAQVAALKARLPHGARVGTVDKFQGQEAPVVIYSTATSSAQDAPRGMKFLFSPNRLNVATSRARCVVVWVGSPKLLAPDCRTVEQMMLANGFCWLGEMGG
ncbi:MAG TPA: TM0106 family RecB-like putative nuclease [Longimicrobiales bacterium]|nr:TM0106 family RecB-like putative nuclease [Longimicrobiales bacterium]